jgi:nitrogen regulatory protein PII
MMRLTVYSRMDGIDAVVRALLAAGAASVTIAAVHGTDYDDDPERSAFAPVVEGKALEVAKIEIVCLVTDVDELLRTLVQAVASVGRGDRIALVRQAEPTVRMRTGEEDAVALRG